MMNNIVVIIIRNSKHQFFVHQRRSDKELFPDLYGLGAGGKINPGESAADAAQRELREETSLKTPIKYLFTMPYQYNQDRYNVSVFETKTDRNIVLDQKEWQWSGWMTNSQLNDLITKQELCPDTAALYAIYSSHL